MSKVDVALPLISLILLSFGLYAQQKNIAGSYKYSEEVLIGYDNCCRAEWDLTLNTDSTFRIDFTNDQGDYLEHSYSVGVYRIEGHILRLFSKVPKELNIIREVEATEVIPDSLFRISIRFSGWTRHHLLKEFAGRRFYSLDKNYKASPVKPLYTSPDTSQIELNDLESVSYVFRKSSIDRFLLCEKEKFGMWDSGSFLIDRDNYRFNDYLIGRHKNDANHRYEDKEFVDVSTYSFTIKNGVLSSVDKFNTVVARTKTIKLKKIKNKARG